MAFPRAKKPYGATVYVNAGNDANGNPRRGWIILKGGAQVAFVNEGYGGQGSLRRACPRVPGDTAHFVKITPGQFRKLRKLPSVCPGGRLY